MRKIILSILALTGMLLFSTAFVDYESSYIPKIRPFGTSFYWGDSTNYIVFSKGLYLQDSLKVAKDLYVGVQGGTIYLDTNRNMTIGASGLGLNIVNTKSGGHQYHSIKGASSSYDWYYAPSSSDVLMMNLDTAGLLVSKGNISLAGTTQQIKIPSDTASDYDNNDNITLNRQSGTLTTKSLTTAAGNLYVLTLTNSLISSTSKIFASLNDGTSTQGLTILYQTRPSSGTGSIVIYNAHASQAFNGTLKIYYVIFN